MARLVDGRRSSGLALSGLPQALANSSGTARGSFRLCTAPVPFETKSSRCAVSSHKEERWISMVNDPTEIVMSMILGSCAIIRKTWIGPKGIMRQAEF